MQVSENNLVAMVQRLVDEADIGRLLYDYAYYLDMNDTEKMLTLFTEDCYTSYGSHHGASGIKEYREILQDSKVGVGAFFAGTSHHVSNMSIDFLGPETARVRSALYAWHRYNRERTDGIVMGQYHDVVVRNGDRWLFQRRELQHTGTEHYHAKGDALNPIARHQGAPAPTDLRGAGE